MTEWQLGIRAFQEGRLREAADRLHTATTDVEQTVTQDVLYQSYAFLGAALYALGKAPAAVDAFSSALVFSPVPAAPLDLRMNLANSYLAAGRRREAEQTLVEALEAYPGAVDARMLFERLQSRAGTQAITGAVLGETPESVKRYLKTLSFSSVPNGYAPEQVHAAINQIEHYIDVLINHLTSRDETISQYAAEIERLRQSEEAMLENMMATRQGDDQWRRRADNSSAETLDPREPLVDERHSSPSPLEKLFQKRS